MRVKVENKNFFLFFRDMGLELFRQHILEEVIVENRCVDGLLMMIEQERAGETIDRSLVKSLLRMLSSLQIYHKIFENKWVDLQMSFFFSFGFNLHENKQKI